MWVLLEEQQVPLNSYTYPGFVVSFFFFWNFGNSNREKNGIQGYSTENSKTWSQGLGERFGSDRAYPGAGDFDDHHGQQCLSFVLSCAPGSASFPVPRGAVLVPVNYRHYSREFWKPQLGAGDRFLRRAGMMSLTKLTGELNSLPCS